MHNISSLNNGGFAENGSAINNAGQITGNSAYGAYLHTGTGPILAAEKIANGGGEGVNNVGQVAGRTNNAFRYTSGVITNLGNLGGTYSQSKGINDSGLVVGGANLANGDTHPFYYDGSIHDMGTLGGTFAIALGVNNSGQIVGESRVTGSNTVHAFLFNGGGLTDLNTLISPSAGWTLTAAFGINSSGSIVGYGTNSLGQNHGFLLTSGSTTAATPEPGTVGLLVGMGGFGLSLARRRNTRKKA